LKKIASILFLFILVFNFWGYRWALSYLEKKATIRLEQRLDAGNYEASQLVEVKIPLKLPYYNEQGGYETFYGAVELNGQSYQYVKRKITPDTLFLLCIRHSEKNDLRVANTDYFRSVNNLQHDGQQKGNQPASIKLMLSEFLPDEHTSGDGDGLGINKQSFAATNSSIYSLFNPLTPAQPPEC
jgi:hypothetical protein